METLKIGLGEIVAGIPTVLGHEPREAVVALSLNEAGLPTCAFEIPRSVLLDEDSAGYTAAAVAEELCEDRGYAVLLVSYTDADIRGHCPALEALRLEVDLAVLNAEVLAVKDGEWFRPGCFDSDCCPRDLPEVPVAYANIVEAARRRADEGIAREYGTWSQCRTRNSCARGVAASGSSRPPRSASGSAWLAPQASRCARPGMCSTIRNSMWRKACGSISSR